MVYRLLTRIVFVALAMGSFVDSASAQAESTRNCSAEAQTNINHAIQYMEENLDTLVNDYEFDTRLPRADDRIQRRMRLKIDDIKVHCADRIRCRGDHIGVSAGLITDKVHICYEKLRESGAYTFCDLVGVIAHEYGHMISMPTAGVIDHNNGAVDATRMFGWFVEDLCRQDSVDRRLDDLITPVTHAPEVPTHGSVLFSQRDFRGRGRNVTSALADLRQIGRNDAVSSLQILSGSWEVCEAINFGGRCVTVSSSERDLSRIGLNDTISSVRPGWHYIGHANEVVAMAAIDGRLFAADAHNRLWQREAVAAHVDWHYIGHANEVVAMAATREYLFAADRENRLWLRTPAAADITWQHIGHANEVVAMAATGGHLFAVDEANRLWTLDITAR